MTVSQESDGEGHAVFVGAVYVNRWWVARADGAPATRHGGLIPEFLSGEGTPMSDAAVALARVREAQWR